MKKYINAVVRIEYEQDEDGYWSDLSMDEVEDTAMDLAFRPNFDTTACGVSLKRIHIQHVEPYGRVDWYDLEKNPDITLV